MRPKSTPPKDVREAIKWAEKKKPRSLFFKRKYPQITTPPFKPLVAELKIELLEVKQTDINNTIDSIISDLMNNENLQVLLINDLADILF